MSGKYAVTALTSLLILASPSASGQTEPNTEPTIQVEWQRGPTVANLGGIAQLVVPAGYEFTDKKGAQKILEATHNLVSQKEVGALVPIADDQTWFVIFEFSDVGYVKDDEKDKIDADGILKGITEGTEEANEERTKRGWTPFHIVGWEKPPYYDPVTHNLTWAIRGKADSGSISINHSIRLLGRGGTMNVDLILGPKEYAQALPPFDAMLRDFKFNPGRRYSDFVSGDKVAEYGLTALIAGGAGALAVKTGLLAKSWKLIVAILLAAKKLVIFVFVGIAALFRKLKNWIASRGGESERTQQDPTNGVGTVDSQPIDGGIGPSGP